MRAYLSTKDLWEYVDGSTPEPVPANPAKGPTADEKKEIADWKWKRTRASGEIWLALENDQKTHISELDDDPTAMWAKLTSVHLQKKPGTRFNAYDKLFSIRKDDNESLTALMTRAEKASQDIKQLCPPHFTIEMLNKELQAMSLIRASSSW
jgi:hypothetical protein